jgi:GT2 family glycosyltransferase
VFYIYIYIYIYIYKKKKNLFIYIRRPLVMVKLLAACAWKHVMKVLLANNLTTDAFSSKKIIIRKILILMMEFLEEC